MLVERSGADGAPAKWGGRGADLGRLTRSRGMVNERQAVWWGIPSQLIQWRVTWLPGRRRPEQGVATSLVGHGQAPLERWVVVGRWEAGVQWEDALRREVAVRRQVRIGVVALRGFRILPGRFQVELVDRQFAATVTLRWGVNLASWRVPAGFGASGVLGLEAAVRHVTDHVWFHPTLVEPSVHWQFWSVEVRLRFAGGQHGEWARPTRRAGSGSTLGQGVIVDERGFTRRFQGLPGRWSAQQERWGPHASRLRSA
jgi:hypothetical protein